MPLTSLAPFRHRSFALVWAGALVSNVGTWMETTALSYYVADTAKVSASGLVAAIGLSSTQWNLGRILGPTAAAVAISLGGIGTALWINSASFAAVIIAVSLASVPHRIGVIRPVWRAVQDGIRFARTTPAVRAMVPVMVVAVFLGSPFIGFIAQMATNVFDGDARSTSLLVTAQGVGALAAGMMLGSMSARFGVRRIMAVAVMTFGPALVLYGLAPSLPVAA